MTKAQGPVRAPDHAHTGPRLPLLGGVVVGVVLALLTVVVVRSLASRPNGDDLLLGASDLAFSTQTLEARAGEVTLAFANTDAVPHTFTVRALGVDVEAGGGEATRTTFTAEPGTYDYVCTIPGHDNPEMRGVLTVVR